MGLFDLNSAMGAAGTGSTVGTAFGGPLGSGIGALAGGILGGFLGGGPQLPKELRNLYRMQYGLADQMRRFSQSVPLSDPGEQGALAEERGLLGQEQQQQRGDLFGELNLNNATQGQIGDFASNLSNQQTGQRMALDSQHLLNALSTRRQAILQASNIAGNAAAGVKDYQQPPDFASLFGNIARLATANQGQGTSDKTGQNQSLLGNYQQGAYGQQAVPGTSQYGITPALSDQFFGRAVPGPVQPQSRFAPGLNQTPTGIPNFTPGL